MTALVTSDTLDTIVSGLTAAGLAAGLVGIGARLVLLPWLREHIATPVKETNRQVTLNGHVSPDPTLRDKVDTLADAVEVLDTKAEDARVASVAAGLMLEGHLDRSSNEWGRLWEAIEELRHAQNRRREDIAREARHRGEPPS